MKTASLTFLTMVASVCFSSIANAQSGTTPEAPRVYLNSSYSLPVSGVTRNVMAGGDLQQALNLANPGDVIVLQAGATFTGNFVLPNKAGADYIYIRTSAPDTNLPAPGIRVNPSFASAMPKIVSPNSGAALATAQFAHHYRLVGIELTLGSSVATNYGILTLGDAGTSQNTLAVVPHDIVVDRCYIHGNATGNISRGIALNSASTSIVDSYIANIHGAGLDTQAICGWNGPGPFKIVNNYLEASGENVLFGGADSSITNLVPADIEFRRNFSSKPLNWNPMDPSFNGIGGDLSRHWTVKNQFELKNARRVIIDGNTFENCWVDGQLGYSIVFTPRNQDGGANWSAVQDVSFTNNIVRHSGAGLNMIGWDDIHPSQQTQRVLIKNNLFDDIGAASLGSVGRLYQITQGTLNVTVDHNTGIHTYNVLTGDSSANSGFVYTNNIQPHNQYGVIGTGTGTGTPTLNTYYPACSFMDNVLAGGPSSSYPAQNFFPASMNTVGFVDYAGHNYRLAPTSTYHNAGTDGTDLGANIDAIEAAQVQLAPPGADTLAVYIPSTGAWFMKNSIAPGSADVAFGYGAPAGGYVAIRGDWNGDGVDTPGLYVPSTGAFFLRNTNTPGPADIVFGFGAGNAGYIPVTGDWNGDGIDTIGLYQPATGFFFLKNMNSSGGADVVVGFGPGGQGWKPVVGDWNGDGTDTIGVYNPANGFFFLKNTNTPGGADLTVGFGPGGQGWLPLAGDFDGNRTDTIAVYNPANGFFFMKNSNTPGTADLTVGFGPPNAVPLVGDWDGQ